ncbi:MAG: sigma-70 family RNA polymerase sigma factor [Candidatus Omnitrophica bacterium]|nr:sigma-70 family RNA polymerase sigma factor [Candidatus Omnitrophota bacterium]
MANPNSPDTPKDYSSDPDVLLMLEAQKGNTASFEALLRKYFSRIFNFAYRYLGSRESAEDIAQETFIRVHRSLASYSPQSKFQTWLYVIARNLCLNELRNNKNRAYSLDGMLETEDGEMPAQFADHNAADPANELVNKETLAKLIEVIESLPENQRTAVLLQRFDGLSYDEIAKVLGCSLQAVKSLLNRAKESLKDKLSSLPE